MIAKAIFCPSLCLILGYMLSANAAFAVDEISVDRSATQAERVAGIGDDLRSPQDALTQLNGYVVMASYDGSPMQPAFGGTTIFFSQVQGVAERRVDELRRFGWVAEVKSAVLEIRP